MTPETFRRLAQLCRDLFAKATDLELKEQLRVWAVEFDACAVAAETPAPIVMPSPASA
jgi:hypothetical protein